MKTYRQFIKQNEDYVPPPKPPAEIRKSSQKSIPHPEVRRTPEKVTKYKSPIKTRSDKGTEEAMLPGMGLVGAAIRRKMKKKDKKPQLKPYQIQPKSKGKVKL